MKNLLNPKWLFVVNTLPIIILFVVFIGQYNVISTLLDLETKNLWKLFAIGMSCLLFCTAAYATWCFIKKRNISIYYAIVSLLLNIGFLYIYLQYIDLFIPFTVPRWMTSPEITIYPGTFLMPTLAHSLFLLVVISVPKGKKVNPWLNFLYSLAFPLLAYLFIQVILPLWQNVESRYWEHVFIVCFIAASTLFLFFMSRGIFVLTTSHSEKLKNYSLYFKIIISIILPIFGLLLNNGAFSKMFFIDTFMFGDFSSIWFYAISLINGIILCLPKFENHYYRLFRFFALMSCFPYTLYFFLVFLPYLPLSVVAIILIGFGFLMLAPLILFILQVNDLYHEYSFFAKSYSKKMLTITLITTFCIVPSLITINYLWDKVTLNQALSYVYGQQVIHRDQINNSSLQNTLNTIKKHKDSRATFYAGNLPFLNSYYNWLVLDNLTLSEAKIVTLERIFFGESNIKLYPPTNDTTKTVSIANYQVESKYDTIQHSWTSTLNLALKNTDSLAMETYQTTFELPTGCWISNYYLNIGKRKEMGILAEKKAALWVFNNIRNENRDPGILYYLTGNKIAFKVFPFASKETRTTGITFVHKEPTKLKIDGHEIQLGTPSPELQTSIQQIDNITYIPAKEKAKLTQVQRKPKYHFIIDISKGKHRNVADYIDRIESYIGANKLKSSDINLNFTNSFTTSINFTNNWKNDLKNQQFEGGFYLEAAIRQLLIDTFQHPSKTYPVIIAVTDSIGKAVIQKDFADLAIAYPEGKNFYELGKSAKIWLHHLDRNPLVRISPIKSISLHTPVYAWPHANKPTAYLTADEEAAIIISDHQSKKTGLKQKSWAAALVQQNNWLAYHLQTSPNNARYLELVKQSIQNQLLSPVTSFIVVENEAQKKALLKKQKEILSGNKNLDPDEDTQSMAEPNLFILLALISIALLFTKHKNILFKN